MTIEGPWGSQPGDYLPTGIPNGPLQEVAFAWHTFTDFWGRKVKDYFHQLVQMSQGPTVT